VACVPRADQTGVYRPWWVQSCVDDGDSHGIRNCSDGKDAKDWEGSRPRYRTSTSRTYAARYSVECQYRRKLVDTTSVTHLGPLYSTVAVQAPVWTISKRDPDQASSVRHGLRRCAAQQCTSISAFEAPMVVEGMGGKWTSCWIMPEYAWSVTNSPMKWSAQRIDMLSH